LKILQINSVCGVGSTGKISTDLYKVLEEQGHQCVIAYGRGVSPKGIKSIKIGSDFDVNVHGVLSRITDKHGFFSKKLTKTLLQKIKEYNPDIINLHNIHGYYINVEILLNNLKEVDKPVIWTLHDCWAITGHCSYFDLIDCNKWQTGCFACPQKKEYPKSILFDRSKNNFLDKKKAFCGVKNMILISPSEWLANILKKSFLNTYNIKVINNGIDLSLFNPKDKMIAREKLNINMKTKIYLGVAFDFNIISKGFNDFLKLAEMIDDNSKIILVGVSKEQIKKLPHKIIGITRTNNATELAELYSAADVFVNPTYVDNYPTVNLEAIACGTPVAAYNTGGISEQITDKTGFVVKKGDVNALFDATKKIIENYNEFSNCCIIKSIDLDKNKNYMEYIELYNNYMYYD
jgi:putative colanic acid biosynthesis glycosyltransferase